MRNGLRAMFFVIGINFNAKDAGSIKTFELCGLKGVKHTREQLNGIMWMYCLVTAALAGYYY